MKWVGTTPIIFYLAIFCSALSICLYVETSASHAGFEWVPSTEQPEQTIRRQKTGPNTGGHSLSPSIDVEALSPIQAQPNNNSVEWSRKAQDQLAHPVQPMGAQGSMAPAPFPYQPTSPEMFTIAEGFGTDVPLALALSHIVPPVYSFSFGFDVNPGYRVSWTGGKPWNDVISDMIQPLGLQSSVQNKIVYVYANNQASGMYVSPPPSSAPVPLAPLPPLDRSDRTVENQVARQNTYGIQGIMTPVRDSIRRTNVMDPGIARRGQSDQTVSRLQSIQSR